MPWPNRVADLIVEVRHLPLVGAFDDAVQGHEEVRDDPAHRYRSLYAASDRSPAWSKTCASGRAMLGALSLARSNKVVRCATRLRLMTLS
jgi:hypothetical protein